MVQNVVINRDCLEDGDAAKLRRLAERPAPTRRARLGLRRGAAARLEGLLSEARRLQESEDGGDEALSILLRSGRVIETLARQAAGEGGARLPAWEGEPRALRLMARLVGMGDKPLTRDGLLAAVEAFDAMQPMTMAELWAVPTAARIALAQAFLTVAASVVRRGRLRKRAERWVEKGGAICDAPAFIEHALKLVGEAGRPRARQKLEAHLNRQGIAPEEAAKRSQQACARDALRLENLLAARRMLDGLNWQACFRALSPVDRTLRREGAGVYADMDDDSRAAVRAAVASLAEELDVPEIVAASHAVDAARQGRGVQGDACWWLYEDAGRAALARRMGKDAAHLKRRVPDPTGGRTVALHISLAALLALGFSALAGSPWLLAPCALLGWNAAGAVIGRGFSRWVKPSRLLKLEMERVPDACRTLVTMPVLLSDAGRVDEVCDQLEALGSLEADANIEYLLLGDFADAPNRDMPGDEEILERARARIAGMNARAGREKYAYLHRNRSLLETDGVWMGRERKRGALEALNRLLLDESGAAAAFDAEGAACSRLKGRFAYVLTLDADTRLLPEEARRLIGAMAHPLNRHYAVLQPRMEPLPSACVNGFVKRFAGAGGVSAYPVAASNLWQDVTGRGIYAGKGIYDVRAFHDRLDGALPEGRVLSHDLIEGALAGAASVGDVAFYDGFPTTLSAYLRRWNRWIRGDWQLLPLMGMKRLRLTDRFHMLDNLMRSMQAPATLALLVGAVWMGSGEALLAALIACYLEPILNPRPENWRRATVRLAILPAEAWCCLDGALRTLWRLAVSGRNLLQWVTAADAEARESGGKWAAPGRLAAFFLLPGLLVPGWALAALALMALFLIGPGWVRDMEAEKIGAPEPLSVDDRAFLTDLARDTWRFFEATVAPELGLPPDNVQLDPPVGAARRTSPTNIALYLLSCLSASRLGFIGQEEARTRMTATAGTLEGLEKWRGHLYNWTDLDTLAPLRPRYVSSVDSGNLAAALLACANAPEAGEALAARLRKLAEGMDFAALYDADKELFFIGLDGETGRLSQSRYDLIASEARLTSYVAMALGQVPPRHWRRLGRPCAMTSGGVAPLSWSGTMFEYLLPLILMDAPENTLLGDGARAAVAAQIAEGRRRNGPWGVSESGYCALDAALNYQYRAFGLKELALGGECEGGVIAPYASALAAMVAPKAAVKNLKRMAGLGWRGAWGFYEAADAQRPGDGEFALVKSHMAHHQGMILCALCNALTGNSLRRDFMTLPRARGLSLLLEERVAEGVRARKTEPDRPSNGDGPRPRGARIARKDGFAPETHVLTGGGATALWTGDGAFHYRRFGVDATRFSGDLLNRADAACLHVTNPDTGESAILGGAASHARLEPGLVCAEARLGTVEAELAAAICPEDGTLIRAVSLRNAGEVPARVALTDAVPVALARGEDYRAHPAFQNLFVESRRLSEDGLVFARRPGSLGEAGFQLVHALFGEGELTFETDYEKLVGREGDTGRPGSLAGTLTCSLGATLNPVSALRAAFTLAPGQRVRAVSALCLLEKGASAQAWHERWRAVGQAQRALKLSAARARASLGFLGLNTAEYHALQRLAALLFDGRLAARARGMRRGEGAAPRNALWALGLSGDRPLLELSVKDGDGLAVAKSLIRAHALYRSLGLTVDLALIDDGGDGYARPLHDALEALVSASHLNARRGEAGGVWLLDGGLLSMDQRAALRRWASATFTGGGDLTNQIRALLANLDGPMGEPPKPMLTGASVLRPVAKALDNGLGGFLPDGRYAVDLRSGHLPPGPWCDLLANDAGGLLLTERGGGCFWAGNSRMNRLTAWTGDALREGWGLKLFLTDERGSTLPLLPGARPALPFRACYGAGEISYAFSARRVAGTTTFFMAGEGPEIGVELALENRDLRGERLRLVACVDWLMGADARDGVALNTWHMGGACFATGACAGVGWLAALDAGAQPGPGRCLASGRGLNAPGRGEGGSLAVPLDLRRGKRTTVRLALGWSEDVRTAQARVNALRDGGELPRQVLPVTPEIDTPDEGLNLLFNGFLFHQVRASRVLGRTGFYQPGGAWGFRDQLQDMLALMHAEPERARAHLLRCAARQFEAGDVLHWWHAPYSGVRTRISDDLLFLPYMTAAYVTLTGDEAILGEVAPYLEDVAIPEGQRDVYRDMRPGAARDTLHGHCMRAFRRAARTGSHGLLRMGAGDWNDGMDKVGAAGQGESVWLTQFAACCADAYREVAPKGADRDWLEQLSRRLKIALEVHGWDGGWYLRAYADDGAPLGSASGAECRIDGISQAWAVFCGLDGARCRMAMDAAWERLVDEKHGLIRLLAPPFDGRGVDPGYIRGYPLGVRENGGQYTHGALWLLLALIRRGDAERAHRALQMLLPVNHADSPEKVSTYRVEPYAMAADVYDRPGMVGRGGWTWYTGSAAWMIVCVLELLGYERRGSRVRLSALLGDWPRAGLTVPFGASRYHLICEKSAARVTLDGATIEDECVTMIDDGKEHTAVFPARSEG